MARPTKYDDDRADRIINALRMGATRRAASSAGPVHYETMLNWMGRYSSFSDKVEDAENAAELRFTLVLTKAANDGDAASAEKWLKRRRREDWGDNVTIDIDKAIADTLALLAGTGETEIP